MELRAPEWVDRVTSTNTVLLERLGAGERLPDGFVLAAREQTAGRGRGRHAWRSQPGRDLSCSLVLAAPDDPLRVPSLALAVALGAAAALEELGVRARTKWPNDVIAGGRKIAGILPERSASRGADRAGALVVGIGLNVNMSGAEAAAIDQPATSILAETGRPAPVPEVLEGLLRALSPRLAAWRAGGFAALSPEWSRRCVGLGRPVEVADGVTRRRGILAGFGARGQLLLRQPDGRTVEVWSGSLILS